MDELESKKAEEENQSGSTPSDEELIQEGKAAAILGYIPFMCFVPLVKMKDNPFAVKHGKQGLILFFLEIIAAVFLLPKISQLFWGMVIILCLVSALAGILNAVQGKEWKIPFIGELGDRLKL
ncbi:MAG: hypothetical protein MUO78_07220 [candidate division Zixibacteria bacterium]|nr:hypothetical protein [candidate division Zixibacteria bacterium]